MFNNCNLNHSKFLKSKFMLLFFSSILVCSMFFVSCQNQNQNQNQNNKSNYSTYQNGTDEKGKAIYEWPNDAETGMIDVNGGKIPYRVYGKDKSGTPIICLHGGPGGQYTSFYKQVSLSENRPVVLYQQIGSDGSEISDEYLNKEKGLTLFTIENFCNELKTVIDYFGYKEYILHAQSWGCMLAAEFAAKFQPASLKGIIFSGPFLNVDRWVNDGHKLISQLPNGEEKLAHILECERTKKFDEQYKAIDQEYTDNCVELPSNNVNDKPSFPKTSHIDYIGITSYDYMWGKSEFSCNGTLQHHDSTPCLQSLKCPVLFMPGQYDSGTPEAAFEYCKYVKNGEVAVIPGCGHHSLMERPNECNAIINGYLQKNNL